MAFIDEITVYAAAGKGGDGVVRWLHLKGKEFSGPAGGNGGDGGDIYVRGVHDIGLLARYRGNKRFIAGDGKAGENRGRDGARGKDLIIDVPIGSIVHNRETGERFELLEEGQQLLILKGGRGGAGNKVFKSSVNRTPTESTNGAPGETAELFIELRLIANAGFIGLPNAGKTSLLNALTHASGKVGSYAFTTLDPNLGVLYGYILADIPGLIEGASEGRGLGSKFLRHISRTKLLIHCVSLESDDPLHELSVVEGELAAFEGGVLLNKPQLLVLTKSDMQSPDHIAAMVRKCSAQGKDPIVVSILDDASLSALAKLITQTLATL